MNDTMTNDDPAAGPLVDKTSDNPYVFKSSEQQKSPRLSHRSLTLMLTFMCLIPVATIAALWQYLPPVFEGELEASVTAESLPDGEFYAVEYYNRPPVEEEGILVVQNNSEQDWTHLNILVNGNYQIYDTDPIPAHESKRYKLSRFVNRTGARFSLQYNELSRVRIYARRPTKDRATFYHEFPTHFPVPNSYWPSAILLGVFAVLLVIAAVVFAKLGKASATA